MKRDYARKVMFSQFLPFGIISRNVLDISMRVNPTAGVIYNPDIPMEMRMNACERTRLSNTARAGAMERNDYISSGNYKYGEYKCDQFFEYALTRSSFFLLTGTPDTQTERERLRLAAERLRPADRNKKEMNYLPSADLRTLNQFLYGYATEDEHNPEDSELYDELFWEAVSAWDITPMANVIALAKDVAPLLRPINGRKRYQLWRISNVNAMFRQAGFLSMLDRRHIDTNWAFNGLCAQEPGQTEEGDKWDIPAITSYSLRKWYADTPDSYLFENPGKSWDADREAWASTPTFYSVNEIPGLKPAVFEGNIHGVTGHKNIVRHTCVGVGIGASINYMIYHTKPKKEAWKSGVERTSALAIQEALNNYDLNNPVLGAGRIIRNALIFCDTIYQFAALFDDVIKLEKYYQKKTTNYGYPYESFHIILLNGAGINQLSRLMESTPINVIKSIAREIREMDSSFMDTGDLTYPLAYKNLPVFLAHDLDLYRLRRAIEDRRAGRKFYVMCYPEQVKYLRKILPDVEFL